MSTPEIKISKEVRHYFVFLQCLPNIRSELEVNCTVTAGSVGLISLYLGCQNSAEGHSARNTSRQVSCLEVKISALNIRFYLYFKERIISMIADNEM